MIALLIIAVVLFCITAIAAWFLYLISTSMDDGRSGAVGIGAFILSLIVFVGSGSLGALFLILWLKHG